jgi:hypothetical protein
MRHGVQCLSEEISWKKWKQQNKGRLIQYLSNSSGKNGLFIYQLCSHNKYVFHDVPKLLMVRLGNCGLLVKMNHLV